MGNFSVEARKIDPSFGFRGDGTPMDNDRVEIGPTALAYGEWEALGLGLPNLSNMRQYRLDRIVSYLQRYDYGGILLFDPLNIRYATDCTNMQLWITHNAARACFVSAGGYCILWDFHSCRHLSSHLPLVREVRHGASFFYFESGSRVSEHAMKFAGEVDSLLREHCGGNRRLAVDKIEIAGHVALCDLGIEVCEGQEVMELARSVKGVDEILGMRCAISSCEASMEEMRLSMCSGISENELWSHLHSGNICRGGEWIETRLLSSGVRTNPWFQECGPRIISDGELVAFDTDLVGVYGFCCDISRTWLCGDVVPSVEQRELYRVAYDNIESNISLLRGGMSFLEYSGIAAQLPSDFMDLRYGCLAHGVGLCDEYPIVRYVVDNADCGYDGIFEVGMVICVEAYVGRVGGCEGVKLEEQVLLVDGGCERLSSYRFEESLLA